MFFQKYFRWIVVALLALLYFGSVWQRPLFTGEEFRCAEIAREMIESAPVPRLNGEPLLAEPPLIHWINAGIMSVIGERPAAVRLAGAAATLLTAALILLLGRRSGIPRLGEAAALVWLFSAAVYAAGTGGGGDALFVFFLMLALAMFFFAATEEACRRRIGFLLLAGIGWGGAVLCRGMEGAVLPLIPVLAFLCRQKNWKRLCILPWIPLAAAALIVAGGSALCRWSVPVLFAAPNLSGGFSIARLLLLPLAGTLPWILFLPMVWHGYRIDPAGARQIPLLRFAACMMLMILIVPFFSGGGTAFCFLPCFPAAALLFACGMLRASDRGDYWWVNRVMNLLVWGLLPFPLLLFVLQTLAKFTRRIPSELVLYRFNENYYLPVLALMVMVIWFRMAAREPGGARKFGCFCVGMGFLLLAAPASVPWRFVRDRAPEAFLRQILLPRVGPETTVLAEPQLLPAAAWTLKRTGIGVFAAGAEKHVASGREVVVITGEEARVRRMPAPRTTCRAGELFVVHYQKRGSRGAEGLK